MVTACRRIACLSAALFAGIALAQRPTPLADKVAQSLLPAGISDLPVNASGQLGYFFKDEEDGVDVAHVLGDFSLTVGEDRGLELRSREAVLWINNRTHDGRPYRHIQVLLWRDAEIQEIGKTATSGPALFVTLNTFGPLNTHIDDLTFESSAGSQVYQEGNAIRKAFNAGTFQGLPEDVSLRVFDPSGLAGAKEPEAPRPVILFRSDGEMTGPFTVGELQVLTVIGGVYLARGVPGSNEFLEIRADSVVVFLPAQEPPNGGEVPAEAGLGGEPAPGVERPAEPRPRRERRRAVDRQMMALGVGETEVEAVYLEGDVIMTQGPNMIRATKLYYDFVHEQALILDAVVRTTLVERNLPLYLRAAEIRQLSSTRYAATRAVLTTSEFHTPHYHVGARRVELIDRTPPDPTGRQTGIRAGSFRIDSATLNVLGRPIAWWPRIRGNVETSDTSLQSLRLGFSDDFGAELETKWHLFNLLGYETPKGVDATLHLDYFSERGPAVGVDVDYERDRYYGLIKSYLLSDDGEDFLGRHREEASAHDIRGRFLSRHRQYLEDDWELTLELSYISDKNFLEEFFESEFDNGKEQETLLRLKKQRDNWAFTALLQYRLMDFVTQSERLPDFAFFVEGASLGGKATWFSENRAGLVRYRPKDQTFREFLREGRLDGSGSVFRGDTRQEVEVPLDVGDARLVPFAALRGTAWDDSPEEGGLLRGFGVYGLRSSMYLWRIYPDVHSDLFDVHGVRHVIKPDVTAWMSHSTQDSDDLFPFDETVEGINEVDGATLGLRQRWQTRRGEGENRRTVDVFTWDLEAGFFADAKGDEYTNGFASYSRPENSIAQNFVNSSTIWRVNDRTALANEINYDVNDGEIDVYNLSLVVERPPRLSYLVGYRFINETDSNLLGFDMNYQLTEKHTIAFRERFDLDRGRTLDFTVAFIRKLPRWFTSVSFALDEAEDDFGISFSLWPEGLSRSVLGSRRFTGLSTSTGLRNE